jgi:pyruvate/2-oxoglutarate dehydrogenase complex dihydrolipoamide dehydrogenase (E3) component
MSSTENYDVLVIGSGEGGKYLAWTMAGEGHRTAVVERKLIGGSCPNIACLPSKNIIHSAKVRSFTMRAAEFGVELESAVTSMKGVQARKRAMVDSLLRLHLDRYRASGAELVMGEARFVGERTVDVGLADRGTRRISGERVFLDLGTRATVPDVPGLVAARPMTHVELLDLDRLPEHLIEGASGSQVRLVTEGPDGGGTVEGTDLLVGVGRTPNTAGIGLERAGVKLTGTGYIAVDDRLATTAAGVWAVGECAGSPKFTHVAFDDFQVVHDNLNGGSRTTRDRLVPYCIYTDPELARVGCNESEARRRGIGYRLLTQPMAAVLRTRTLSEPRVHEAADRCRQ